MQLNDGVNISIGCYEAYYPTDALLWIYISKYRWGDDTRKFTTYKLKFRMSNSEEINLIIDTDKGQLLKTITDKSLEYRQVEIDILDSVTKAISYIQVNVKPDVADANFIVGEWLVTKRTIGRTAE